MPSFNVPPTKSSLRRVRADLNFASEGYGLLDQKREFLVLEIVKRVNAMKEIERRFESALNDLYGLYRQTAMVMGSAGVGLKSLSITTGYTLALRSVKVVGIPVPEIDLEPTRLTPPPNLMHTAADFDAAQRKGRELLGLLGRYAALTKTVFLLSRELKKLQRRVNALEKIFIPQYTGTVKYITERLDETEREEIYVRKLIRARLERSEGRT